MLGDKYMIKNKINKMNDKEGIIITDLTYEYHLLLKPNVVTRLLIKKKK